MLTGADLPSSTYLRQLEIRQVRCLGHVRMAPGPMLNVITGPNASGKTSVLESIHLLGVGRSFRSRSSGDLISRSGERLTVFGEVVLDERVNTLGVERGREGNRFRISGGEAKAASALARVLPLVLITPDAQRLLSDGARLRRRMLDWAMFHVEPSYHQILQRYRQTLRQRNALLRTIQPNQLGPWNHSLASLGTSLHRLRLRFLEQLQPNLDTIVHELLARQFAVTYQPGWPRGDTLESCLESSQERESSLGYTTVGPHRADLRFTVDGSLAQQSLSRGEAKLFVAGILLAQASFLAARTRVRPVVLVDELASELDREGRRKFMDVLRGVGGQTFVTSVSPDLVQTNGWEESRLFHVEQGNLRELV